MLFGADCSRYKIGSQLSHPVIDGFHEQSVIFRVQRSTATVVAGLSARDNAADPLVAMPYTDYTLRKHVGDSIGEHSLVSVS
jgi:hypothetical protein